jgi:ABC-type transport system involved in multi-copper enzyme maturation permease subunit
MAIRISPGPVFIFESLILARRRQVYVGRAIFVFAVLIGLTTAWYEAAVGWSPPAMVGTGRSTLQILALTGEKFFYALAAIQLAMVLLVSPAATAAAICHDRARGILAQLAATDLSDAEIVLGKLGSRLAPILGVLACGLPVSALAALLGGIDPQALVSLFAVSAAVAALGCALALAISVRAAMTHDVIIAVLALWITWLVSLPIWSGMTTIKGVVAPPEWFKKSNPFVLVYAPYAWPGHVALADVATFVAAVLLISAGLIAMTIVTFRRSVLEPARRVRRVSILDKISMSRWLAWLPGPSLDGNPVLWREWNYSRPSRFVRMIWLVFVIGSVVGGGIGIHEAIVYGPGVPSGFIVPSAVLLLQFVFGLSIVTSLAPAPLAEERVRGSLDVLMTTPLSTRSILWGKWLGTFRVVLCLAVLPCLLTMILACLAPPFPARMRPAGASSMELAPLSSVGRVLAPCLVVAQMLSYGAAITSAGIALATWVSRLGRAIAINVAIMVLIAIGWPLFFDAVIWAPLQQSWGAMGMDAHWLASSMMAISPFGAPIVTLQGLLQVDSNSRWKVWFSIVTWCILASAIATALFQATLATFDRCMGRMPEPSEWD